MDAKEKIQSKDIWQAFRRVATSEGFVRSERMVTLLEYVISKTLDGQADSLKAFSIGLDVFKIGLDADPEKNAVVRVEMGRLRKKLEHYYHTAGATDAIRIEIPKGNYRPMFLPNLQETVSGPIRNRRVVALCVVVSLLCVLVAGMVLVQQDVLKKNGTHPKAPIVEIALFKNYSGLKKMDHMAAGLSFDIVSELARFSWLAVFVARKEKALLQTELKAQAKKSAVVPDYILSGNVNITNDRIVVAYRLVATRSHRVRWSKTFARALTVKDIYAIQQETATAIAVEVGRPEGVVKRLEQAHYRKMPTKLSTYVCTLMIYRYWRTFSSEDHLKTRNCLETAHRSDPDYAESQAALSFIYLDEMRYHKNRRVGYDPLQQSLQKALHAVEIDPFSTLAKQALFAVKVVQNDLEAFEKIGREAIALAPNNPELLGDYGSKLSLFALKWEKGLRYSRLALELNSDPAPWYFVALGYKSVIDKDYRQALKWSVRMSAPDWLHYHVIRVISFAGLKDQVGVRDAIEEFKGIGVNHHEDAAVRIDSWGGHKTIRQELKDRLKEAYIFAHGGS